MAPARRPDAPDRSAPRARTRGTSDDFFRHMVANMRNGVLAIWSASDLDQAPTPTDAVDQWLDRAMTDNDDRPLGGSW